MAEAQADLLLVADDRRNFALLVDGKKVYVDRSYLAAWSPVFNKIFYPEGAPFKQPEGGMLMKEKKLDEFLVFLRAICPTSKALRVDQENVALLVAYADEYDVWVLRERCVEFVQKQLKKGKAAGETLIDYLRLATLYNLRDLQKELVPTVAQLSIDKITAAHAQLPLSVLSAVYQSKALSQQTAVEEGSPLSMPEGAFYCAGCNKTTCSITKGASSCCNQGVSIASSAAAQVEAKCSFTCAGCNRPCSLSISIRIDIGFKLYHRSSCCLTDLFIYAKCGMSKKRSADAAAAAPPLKATHFSADLLDRDK